MQQLFEGRNSVKYTNDDVTYLILYYIVWRCQSVWLQYVCNVLHASLASSIDRH